MIETIYIGMSGLVGYSTGLRSIANNVANLNTPGFKSSTLSFSDQFYSSEDSFGQRHGSSNASLGHGVVAGQTALNFRQGDLRQTGNDFDLAIEGQGLFVLRNDEGDLRYTRAGQFEFNPDGVLVERSSGDAVMALDDGGRLVELGTAAYRISKPVATTSVRLAGNLSSTESQQSVDGVDVIDAQGQRHVLSLRFTRDSGAQTDHWEVALMDGDTVVNTAGLDFVDGQPKAGAGRLNFDYTPAGRSKMVVVMDFSNQVTSFAAGTVSTLAVVSQDGRELGALDSFTFDAHGVLQLGFDNGQKAQGPRLALARVEAPQQLSALGANAFATFDGVEPTFGAAGQGAFGDLSPGSLEVSNVDLSQEFSDMVIMQRGYQASAQVVSTANDMLQELFGMRR